MGRDSMTIDNTNNLNASVYFEYWELDAETGDGPIVNLHWI